MARHILYLDDVPDHLVLMQQFIERSLPGVVVDTCESVAGAQVALSKHCYDLIISDINLRDGLGTRVVERILDSDSEQPTMLVSEYVGDNVEKQIRALEKRGVSYWPKFAEGNFDELIVMVRKLLAKRPCQRLSASEDHPDFCRFKICMRPDHGGELADEQTSARSPKLVLIQPAVVAA